MSAFYQNNIFFYSKKLVNFVIQIIYFFTLLEPEKNGVNLLLRERVDFTLCAAIKVRIAE